MEKKVKGKIDCVEEYGIYLSFDGGRIIVLIPDASSERIKCLKSTFSVGQELDVFLIKYIEEKKIYKGSLVSSYSG